MESKQYDSLGKHKLYYEELPKYWELRRMWTRFTRNFADRVTHVLSRVLLLARKAR